ncbi:type II toxin-antitoxin system RelE/ParE family toxin [Candidatus Halobeggiatoa sp. HSG11]|nr:type II toxin-antitoxin system RelE/ParE family toxin [Candidatus Halobeggiatoa sp. HSG11]
MFELFETEEFLKNIDKLQNKDAIFIRKKLASYVYPQLRNEPRFGLNIKKLKNYTPETWRYRIGKYRVFYSIDEEDNLVFLLIIEARKNAY